jgi:hypothetical protein
VKAFSSTVIAIAMLAGLSTAQAVRNRSRRELMQIRDSNSSMPSRGRPSRGTPSRGSRGEVEARGDADAKAPLPLPLWKKCLLNTYFVVFMLLFSWTLVGAIWYRYTTYMSSPTAYFFAVNAGLSIAFCKPDIVEDPLSIITTLIFVLAGSTIILGSLGYLGMLILTEKRRHIDLHKANSVQTSELNGRHTVRSVCRYAVYKALYHIGWYSNRSRAILLASLVGWWAVGIAYTTTTYDWDFVTALYWAVTSCSTGGLQQIPCASISSEQSVREIGECDLGARNSFFLGTYLLVGVPLNAIALHPFAVMTVKRVLKKQTRQELRRPITRDEFLYAANLLSPAGPQEQESQSMVLGEFIYLELLRMGKTSTQQLALVKEKFTALDEDGCGYLDLGALRSAGYIVPMRPESMRLFQRYQEAQGTGTGVGTGAGVGAGVGTGE